MAGKKGRSGGKREGAGRPRNPKPDYDADFREYCENARIKVEQDNGQSIAEAVFSMIFNPDIQDTVKVSIWNKYCEMNTVKKSESDVNVTRNDGPAIGLPEMDEDSALKVVDGGKA
jgi:hypothetical protein